MSARATLLWASILGFLAVALGAFGAHALAEHLEEAGRVETWQTAVLYHLVHAVVLLGVGLWRREVAGASLLGWAALFFVIGAVIFAGTLYTLCLTGIGWLGAITPLGGVSLLIGWACLAVAALRERR